MFLVVEILDSVEKEGEIILNLAQVLCELRSQLCSHGTLLGLQETLKEHSDGNVHILFAHVLSQMHLGMGFTHSEHGLNVPD